MGSRQLIKIALLLAWFSSLPIHSLWASGFNLSTLFPDLSLGFDPVGPESVFITCGTVTATSVEVQVWVGTDNSDTMDALTGIFVPIVISSNKPGVTLDTTSLQYMGAQLYNLGSIKP